MAVRLFIFLTIITSWTVALNEHQTHVTTNDGDSGQAFDRKLLLQLSETVQSLKQENSEQSKMLQDMREAMQQQQREMRKMEARLQKCEQLTQTRPETGENRTSVSQIGRNESNVSSRLTKRDDVVHRIVRQGQGSTVAFSAVASNSINHYGAASSNIRFEKIDINIPSAYDPQTGTFTAPSAGIYVISASILSVADRETSCDIVVNGNARARLYARGTDQKHDQGSQTVLFRLDGGDVVSVQNEAADDSVHGGLYTTFSGFLLPEEPSISSIIG